MYALNQMVTESLTNSVVIKESLLDCSILKDLKDLKDSKLKIETKLKSPGCKTDPPLANSISLTTMGTLD